MKKVIFGGLVVILGLVALGAAHDEKMPMPVQKPTSAEFNSMKKLVGNWKGIATHADQHQAPEPIAVSFRLTAAGSAIEESLGVGSPQEMVDMYHDENGRLAMTHYCAMGNQPHMVMTQAAPHLIAFQMGPTPGIKPSDPHMHGLVLEMPDADHLTERWTSYTNGQPSGATTLTLARVK